MFKLFGYNLLENKANKLIKRKNELEEIHDKLLKSISDFNNLSEDLIEREKALKVLKEEYSKGSPSLANVISEYFYFRDIEIVEYYEDKIRPAYKCADELKKHAKEKKELKRENIILRNYIDLYENVFPFIKDIQSEDIDFILNKKGDNHNITNLDPVKKYVPEYDRLSEEERCQKALEKYKSSKKSNLELGVMYERYIGYLYEIDGFNVEYVGIKNGFQDMGRDLVCKKNNETHIIQCKYWASHKEIQEAHINQLYGTTVKYFIDEFKSIEKTLFPELLINNIRPILVTSTDLSITAQNFADVLGVEVIKNRPLEDYPMIKCNLSEGIYHLPFDQQYDNINMNIGEKKYVFTVKEAINLNCRRAYKWKSITD